MATCSSDQSVKVWDLQDDGSWKCVANWKTHSGSVWKVTWGHPLYGQLIATCSFDRTAALWEETVGDGGSVSQSHWVKRASFVDSRGSVTDIQFAPKSFGLQLATTSADGTIRVYENFDQSNLSQWHTVHEINSKFAQGLSCIAWSQSRLHPTLLAAGCDDASVAGSKIQVYELVDSGRKWIKIDAMNIVQDPVHDLTFANSLGRSFHTLAIASTDLYILQITTASRSTSIGSSVAGSQQVSGSTGPRTYDLHLSACFREHNSRVWRVSWNITGTILASSGDDGCIRIWRANYDGEWRNVATIGGSGRAHEDGESSPLNRSNLYSRKASAVMQEGGANGSLPPGNNARLWQNAIQAGNPNLSAFLAVPK